MTITNGNGGGYPRSNTFKQIAEMQSPTTLSVTLLERSVLNELRQVMKNKHHSIVTLRYDKDTDSWYVYAGNMTNHISG